MSDPKVQRIVDWVAAREGAAGMEIGPGTDLMATGALDSMGLVALFFLVESISGVFVDPTDAVAAGPITPAIIAERWL